MMNKLKQTREKQGITQDELSRKSGISRTTISMIENRENKPASSKTLLALASALGTTVAHIFFDDDV